MWEQLRTAISDGHIVSPEEVLHELRRGTDGLVLRKYYIRTVGRAGMNATRKGTIGEPVRQRYWFYAATSSFIVLPGPPFTA